MTQVGVGASKRHLLVHGAVIVELLAGRGGKVLVVCCCVLPEVLGRDPRHILVISLYRLHHVGFYVHFRQVGRLVLRGGVSVISGDC